MSLTQDYQSPELILIVEDDKELGQWICDYLNGKGYDTLFTESGIEAVRIINNQSPALVILDGMLPDLDGLDVCRQVRTTYTGHIIMLTARDEEIDEVLGLEVGADDYLTKPVRARALLARIRGLLRRQHPSIQMDPTQANQLILAGLTVDNQTRIVSINSVQINTSSSEFDVLWILASQAGQVVSREALVQALRGFDYNGFDRSIDLKISRLRKKLGDNPNQPFLIKTIWGKGYLLVKDQWGD